MKKIILLVFVFLLMGCAKDITQAEAGGIATSHLIEQVGIEEPVMVNQVILKGDGWHVQMTIGDDKGTVILDRKGNVLRIETYKWV